MDLVASFDEPTLDDFVRILPATAEAFFEHAERRGHDEQGDRVGLRLAHLRRALNVDVH